MADVSESAMKRSHWDWRVCALEGRARGGGGGGGGTVRRIVVVTAIGGRIASNHHRHYAARVSPADVPRLLGTCKPVRDRVNGERNSIDVGWRTRTVCSAP